MLKTIGALSIFLLASVVFTFLYRRQSIRYNISFFAYLLNLLISETVMMIASFYMSNHHLGNIFALMNYCFSIWLVFELWKHLIGKRKYTSAFLVVSLVIFCTGWVLENLVLRTIWTYNPYTPAITSFILTLVIIYLINQLLFMKTNNIFRDPEGLILLGLLVRFFSNCLISIFLNFRVNYSNDFYSNILFLVILVGAASTIFFLMAVLWLPERKKYTWPF